METCGARLRNLLTPYANLLRLIDNVNKGYLSFEQMIEMYKVAHGDPIDGLLNIENFSRTDIMEETEYETVD